MKWESAALGLLDLIKQAGANLCRMGFIIEKSFQEGGEKLRQLGVKVESLALIDDLSDCRIVIR